MKATTRAGGSLRATGLGWPSAGRARRTYDTAMAARAQPRAASGEGGGVPLEAGLGFRLGRAHRMVREIWEKAIADLGLSPPQAALLRAVAERPDSGLRELARHMRTDAMNAKRLADHLERSGLVRSVTDPGHRQRRALQPTEAGKAVAAELAQRAVAQERHLAALIGPADLALIQALLERLESALAPGTTAKDLAP